MCVAYRVSKFLIATTAVLVVCSGYLGCSGVDTVDATALCDDVLQSISQRTLICTNDLDLANSRPDQLKTQRQCLGGQVSGGDKDPRFACSQSIAAIDCTEVKQHGDSFDLWLTDPSCDQVFAAADAGIDASADANNNTGAAP